MKSFPKSSLAYLRQICSKNVIGSTNSSSIREDLMKSKQHQRQRVQNFSYYNKKASIYRVPSQLRNVEPKAYEPHFISIGPYHHGSAHLKATQNLKRVYLDRLIGLSEQPQDVLDKLVASLEAIEHEARECYSEEVQLSKDEFIEMLLLDGCFIVDLFRELYQNNFVSSSLLAKRWMLPTVRRDLIALENQLPMIVLKEILYQTRAKSIEKVSLEELAIRFFDPLMPREERILCRSIESSLSSKERFEHLLDVFHTSITPGELVTRQKEPHMYRSVSELKEAGIKLRALGHAKPLELRFESGILRIPSLIIDNHSSSFFKNIVAFEQCHDNCKPDMTTYVFFLSKLINSAEDVGLLHFEGVIQHSLGSNKQVAELVNNLCLEVEHNGQDSYLCEVVERLNCYSDRSLVKIKTRLKHDYFSNLWTGISTMAAFLFLYLTLLQASYTVTTSIEKDCQSKHRLWFGLNYFLVDPYEGLKMILGWVLRCIERVIDPKDPPPGGPHGEFE